MAILAYILSIVISFIVGGMVAGIPIGIMHKMSGSKDASRADGPMDLSAMWIPAPGNEQRFFTVHNWGQGIGSFASSLVSLLSILWVFSWFDMRPHLVFLILLSIWKVISDLHANARYMPRSQAKGAALGVAIFFYYYVKFY